MLKENFPLYGAGFALHLIREKSKAPLDTEWSTRPKRSFKELKTLFKKGMNVGVRLGSVSEIAIGRDPKTGIIEKGYLAVIDCDVKSTEDRHRGEMISRLKELVPEVKDAPCVESGRGGGSRHYYIVTKKPVEPRRLAQSSEKVKVHMPSAKPSKHELKVLTPAEIKKGLRLKPAWEISLMGERQQVVLPPSIHPDSGKAYKWKREFFPFPLEIEGGKVAAEDVSAEADQTEFPDVIGLTKWKTLSDRLRLMITDGEGVEDRSAALFAAAIGMLKRGFTEEEVVSVLTDKATYLGGVAYEHAKTSRRERAARWIRRYTLKRARVEADGSNDFMEEPPAKLGAKAARAQMEEIGLELGSSWDSKLERTAENQGYKVKATLKNVLLILENEAGPNVFRYNAFANTDIYGCKNPWGGVVGAELTDKDPLRIKRWLAEKWRFEPHKNLIEEALVLIADRNAFHPVRDYLDSLKWDGKERLDTWLKTYMSAEAPEPYLTAVSRKLLVAMVARAYEPGRKYDQVAILQGEQGKRKSTSLEVLASPEWFTDAKLNLHDKDSILSMRAVWLRELGELSGMRKADVDDLKEFISRRTDRIRVPYGKRTEAFPRQCVFVATTNKDEFLKDDTGNRRYWPLTVGKCYPEKLALVRDQLFAEARVAYELGEELYLDDPETEEQAIQEQEARLEHDILEEAIEEFFQENRKRSEKERLDERKFTVRDVFVNVTSVTTRDDRAGQMRVASALRKLGFTKTTARGEDGIVRKYWGRSV